MDTNMIETHNNYDNTDRLTNLIVESFSDEVKSQIQTSTKYKVLVNFLKDLLTKYNENKYHMDENQFSKLNDVYTNIGDMLTYLGENN